MTFNPAFAGTKKHRNHKLIENNMRTKTIRGLSAIIKMLAAVSAATAYFNPELLPARYVIPALILGFCVSTAKDFFITVCDILDDGKRNGSFDVSKLSLMALLCCTLLLASCGSTPGGQKTFIGATGAQWLDIGKGVLIREAPVVYGEVRQAREVTSAKQPLNQVQP